MDVAEKKYLFMWIFLAYLNHFIYSSARKALCSLQKTNKNSIQMLPDVLKGSLKQENVWNAAPWEWGKIPFQLLLQCSLRNLTKMESEKFLSLIFQHIYFVFYPLFPFIMFLPLIVLQYVLLVDLQTWIWHYVYLQAKFAGKEYKSCCGFDSEENTITSRYLKSHVLLEFKDGSKSQMNNMYHVLM